MADLLLSQLEQGKPVKVEKDGKTIMSTETPSQLKSNRGK